jgi:quinol monooxygenase YgiN
MIMVIGTYKIQAHQRDAFLTFARDMVMREQENAGCLSFGIHEDILRPNYFTMIEQWENRDVFEQHSDSEAFDANESALLAFIEGEPSWDEYEF